MNKADMTSGSLHVDNSTTAEATPAPFELEYRPAEDVHPLELIGNAFLALHHHMAPADGGFDLGGEDD
ncbi:hypothetical protein [uncultured Lamprocystis sp.]|uniref:hypothetical protein n=1 Tax=uncultured Lamprocystis sp. TaxID=543132 RepID=UPI0025D13D1E|nr:hypothetical protein [uncultured Lamprocystis sp.]